MGRFPSVFVVVLVLMSSSQPTAAGDRIVGAPFATRSPVLGQHGMVATSHPLASQIGLAVLQEGGTAVDAAIAINAALGLMEPTGCGVGGDVFVIHWDNAARELTGYNGSGRSPRDMTLEWLADQLERRGRATIPLDGGLPVSVPGAVDGWFALHERYGKLPMARLLAPAIRYAQEGFPVTQVIGAYWQRMDGRHEQFPNFGKTFLPGGKAPREGELFRNPDLARTYERIAAGGRAAFYEGEIAVAIAAVVAEHGGRLSVDDLASHHGEWVTPVSVPYRGHELWELPPNGQGIAALQMLRMLEADTLAVDDPATWHLLLEAKKLVYEDRARFYADPAFSELPLRRLLSAEYAAERRALIDPDRAARQPAPGDLALEHGDTIYLTVADSAGNVVSWIQSNYTGFGSGLVPDGCGFGLQNRGQLFSLDPDHANVFAPGKRPFHTIIPAMLTKDGLPVLSFGVMGGAMQPQGHVQIVVNLLDFGMNVQEAGDAPRWRHSGSSQPTGESIEDGGTVHLESGVPETIQSALSALGHHVEVGPEGYGGYQAIWIDDISSEKQRLYRGASESRKDGVAVGW